MSPDQLTAVFHDPAALPQLTRFSLRTWLEEAHHSINSMLSALALTVVGASGRVRPMTELSLALPIAIDTIASIALMRELTSLELNGVPHGWLGDWTRREEMQSAFPLLQQLTVATHWQSSDQQARNMSPFCQWVASCPIQLLRLTTGESVMFDAAAMSALASCHQLRELQLCASMDNTCEPTDWSDAVLLAAFTFSCLPYLCVVELRSVKLSAGSVAAIASAALGLRQLDVSCELSCHPAVVCAIVGGYCEHIEKVRIDQESHVEWSGVHVGDISGVYQSAVAAAGRGSGYRPFTRIRHLSLNMCWCTPPPVWHALLPMLRHATHLSCLCLFASHDPLIVAALAHLSSITSLSHNCQWPLSFATLMERRSERSGRYRYVTSRGLTDQFGPPCPGREPTLELIDFAVKGQWEGYIGLRPHCSLFTAYQRSLSDEQQAVLARWTAGDFHTGDEQLRSADGPLTTHETHGQTAAERERFCPHSHNLHSWCGEAAEGEVLNKSTGREMKDASDGESGWIDEEQPAG